MSIHPMTTPRRRWFQFSLATLFVGVTVVAISMAWVAYQLNWIRERRAALTKAEYITQCFGESRQPRPMWRLTFLGEKPIAHIITGNDLPAEEFDRMTSLFPKAHVVRLPDDPSNRIYVLR